MSKELTITITMEEYEELKRDQDFLNCLGQRV